MSASTRIPATIVSGFLGAGKTSLVRHVLAHAAGRRIAIIVNEFGSLGIDGATLRECGIPGCDDVVELANGCLCCTVADEFLPAMQALLDRERPPEHIVIETSGLALPKPLIKAFGWPDVRSRVTVDGVVTVVDGPAVLAGRFADDPDAVAAVRAADPSLDHDNPLAEVFEDQLAAADLVVLNKADLLGDDERAALTREMASRVRAGVRVVEAVEGRVPVAALLGIGASAEDDLQGRPSCHDAEGLEHEHDDFTSFVVEVPETADEDQMLERLGAAVRAHDILRVKGFLAMQGKARWLHVEGVGPRLRREFGRALRADETRAGRLVVIGRAGLDQAAVGRAIAGD